MATPISELRRGRLAWALVHDRNGFAKERPIVILTPTEEIRPDEPLIAMAVTTTFPNPPPPDHIPLPWHPQGKVGTKLRQRSAAVTSWVLEVEHDDIHRLQGDVPLRIMLEILRRLDS